MSQENTQEVQMGTKVSQYPVDKYVAAENKRDLITVLTKNPIVTKTCFHDDVGYKFHAIPECAEFGLKVAVHYNFLIVNWNTDAKGLQIMADQTGKPVYELAVLSVADRNYGRLVNKFNVAGDLTKLVLQVTCEDAQYQSLQFEIMQYKPPFMLDATLFQEIRQQYEAFKVYISAVVAGKITAKELMDKLGKNLPPSQEQQQAFGAYAQVSQDQALMAAGGGKATGVLESNVMPGPMNMNFDDAQVVDSGIGAGGVGSGFGGQGVNKEVAKKANEATLANKNVVQGDFNFD